MKVKFCACNPNYFLIIWKGRLSSPSPSRPSLSSSPHLAFLSVNFSACVFLRRLFVRLSPAFSGSVAVLDSWPREPEKESWLHLIAVWVGEEGGEAGEPGELGELLSGVLPSSPCSPSLASPSSSSFLAVMHHLRKEILWLLTLVNLVQCTYNLDTYNIDDAILRKQGGEQ